MILWVEYNTYPIVYVIDLISCLLMKRKWKKSKAFIFLSVEIHTFTGRLLAKRDSLGDVEELSLEEKMVLKMSIYEEEMQNYLFGFLPLPNTFVTSITPQM